MSDMKIQDNQSNSLDALEKEYESLLAQRQRANQLITEQENIIQTSDISLKMSDVMSSNSDAKILELQKKMQAAQESLEQENKKYAEIKKQMLAIAEREVDLQKNNEAKQEFLRNIDANIAILEKKKAEKNKDEATLHEVHDKLSDLEKKLHDFLSDKDKNNVELVSLEQKYLAKMKALEIAITESVSQQEKLEKTLKEKETHLEILTKKKQQLELEQQTLNTAIAESKAQLDACIKHEETIVASEKFTLSAACLLKREELQAAEASLKQKRNDLLLLSQKANAAMPLIHEREQHFEAEERKQINELHEEKKEFLETAEKKLQDLLEEQRILKEQEEQSLSLDLANQVKQKILALDEAINAHREETDRHLFELSEMEHSFLPLQKHHRDELTKERVNAAARLKEYEEQRANINMQEQDLLKKKVQLEREILQEEQSFQGSSAKTTAVQTQKASLNKTLADLEAKLQTLSLNHTQITLELDSFKKDDSHLLEELAAVKQQKIISDETKIKMEADFQQDMAKIKQQNAEKESILQTSMEADIKKLQEQEAHLTQNFNKVISSIDQQEKIIAELRKKNEESSVKINGKVEPQTEHISRLEQENKALEVRINEGARTINKIAEELAELTKAKADERLQFLKDQQKSAENKQQAKQELIEKKANLKKIESSLVTVEKELMQEKKKVREAKENQANELSLELIAEQEDLDRLALADTKAHFVSKQLETKPGTLSIAPSSTEQEALLETSNEEKRAAVEKVIAERKELQRSKMSKTAIKKSLDDERKFQEILSKVASKKQGQTIKKPGALDEEQEEKKLYDEFMETLARRKKTSPAELDAILTKAINLKQAGAEHHEDVPQLPQVNQEHDLGDVNSDIARYKAMMEELRQKQKADKTELDIDVKQASEAPQVLELAKVLDESNMAQPSLTLEETPENKQPNEPPKVAEPPKITPPAAVVTKIEPHVDIKPPTVAVVTKVEPVVEIKLPKEVAPKLASSPEVKPPTVAVEAKVEPVVEIKLPIEVAQKVVPPPEIKPSAAAMETKLEPPAEIKPPIAAPPKVTSSPPAIKPPAAVPTKLEPPAELNPPITTLSKIEYPAELKQHTAEVTEVESSFDATPPEEIESKIEPTLEFEQVAPVAPPALKLEPTMALKQEAPQIKKSSKGETPSMVGSTHLAMPAHGKNVRAIQPEELLMRGQSMVEKPGYNLRTRMKNFYSHLKTNEMPPMGKISHAEDLDFVSDNKRAGLQEQSPWAALLLYSVAFFLCVAIIWAKFAILDETTSAAGKVIPSSQVQVIQNLEGGIVSQMFVHEGDKVKKGQILLRIDDKRFSSSYQEGRKKYLALLASIARLEAQVNNQTTIQYPDVVKAEAPDLVNNETQLFNQQLQEVNAKVKTYQQSYDLAKEEQKITNPLVKEGLMSQLELLRLDREVNELSGNIAKEKDEFISKAQQDLTTKKGELAALIEALTAASDRLTRTVVRSPVDGIVNQINISTIGGVIQPGMDIMEIVPTEDNLLIEAKVKPKDIAFIHPDQQALVKVTAYDYSIYGGLEGIVEHISADTLEDKSDTNQKETFYKILVRTHKNYLGSPKKPLNIIPGMTVTVDIKTGKKSVLDYLLKPFLKARQNALRER